MPQSPGLSPVSLVAPACRAQRKAIAGKPESELNTYGTNVHRIDQYGTKAAFSCPIESVGNPECSRGRPIQRTSLPTGAPGTQVQSKYCNQQIFRPRSAPAHAKHPNTIPHHATPLSRFPDLRSQISDHISRSSMSTSSTMTVTLCTLSSGTRRLPPPAGPLSSGMRSPP
jgi:hypothetical protein